MRSSIALTLLATGCVVVSSCNNSSQVYDEEVVQETYVHRYGVEVPPQDWEERGEHGQVVSTLKNGVVVSKNYNAGTLEGDTTYTFPHSGLIEKVETYSNGQLVKETTFYLSGAPLREIRYNPDGTRLLTVWYENGTPGSIEQVDTQGLIAQGNYFDINHTQDAQVNGGEGNRLVRDAFGHLVSQDTIQGGQMILRKTFYPNGTPKEITPYHNGLVEGQLRTFQPGGEPHTIEEWTHGNQTGVTISFMNGEKVTETTYVNGVRNGTERRFRDGTTLIEEITWENDVRHGPSTNYVSGQPQKEWFFKGKPATQASFELQMHKRQF